jgi:hypothetical protein
MEQMNPVDPRQSELLPVVLYAVRRRLASKTPDYWDHATVLELAVLRRDEAAAAEAASDALAAVREYWEPESTARNLSLIRSARERRGESAQWIEGIEAALAAKAKDLKERS